MSTSPYVQVLRRRDAVEVLLLGLLVRTPLAAVGPLLTLHVVLGLGHTYRDAGVVVMVNTLAAAAAGPWRGNLIDRRGLRRTLMVSILVTGACWSVAPFVSYTWLLVVGAVAGLLAAPVWSVVRQALLAAVPPSERRSALSLDSITTEIAFMVGPLLSLWLAATFRTSIVLLGFQLAGVATLVVLWWRNPRLVNDQADAAEAAAPSRRTWLSGAFLAVCVVAFASHVVLIGADLGITAAVVGWDQRRWLGLVYVLWCAGSVTGALVYGALHRHISPFVMLAGLALLSVPMALAQSWVWLAGLSVVAGLLCAPTLTATVEAVSELVPERARGEAMGWHGSFLTVGAAAGAPVTGWFIDRFGFGGGILAAAVFGLLVAVLGAITVRLIRRRRGSAVSGARTPEHLVN